MILNTYFGGKSTKDASAVAGDILAGKTAYNAEGKVEGQMADNGSVSKTLTLQGETFAIPAGYHDGNGEVGVNIEGLSSANIAKGKTVGGVSGTAPVIESGTGLKKTVYFNNVSTSSTSIKTITAFTKSFDPTKTFELYVFQGTITSYGGLRIEINPVTFDVQLYSSRMISSVQISTEETAFPSTYYTYSNNVLTIKCTKYRYYQQGTGSSTTGDYITLDMTLDFNSGTMNVNKAEIYWNNGSNYSTYGLEIFGVGCY